MNAEDLTPFLIAARNPEGAMVVMLSPEAFDTPGIWGIAVADIVQHIVNAYASQGMNPTGCRAELLHYLMAELDSPTDKAQMVRDFDWGEE